MVPGFGLGTGGGAKRRSSSLTTWTLRGGEGRRIFTGDAAGAWPPRGAATPNACAPTRPAAAARATHPPPRPLPRAPHPLLKCRRCCCSWRARRQEGGSAEGAADWGAGHKREEVWISGKISGGLGSRAQETQRFCAGKDAGDRNFWPCSFFSR
jgi:hypothetical protein